MRSIEFLPLAAPAFAVIAMLAFNGWLRWRAHMADPLRDYRRWLRGLPANRQAQMEAALRQRFTPILPAGANPSGKVAPIGRPGSTASAGNKHNQSNI